MNNVSATDHYSSGCCSGWTMYLDESYMSDNQRFPREARMVVEVQEEEEEDLSMVSDASSGPPHYHEDNEEWLNENGYSGYGYPASGLSQKGKNKKKETEENVRNQTRQYSYLDDTASSPVFGFSKKSENSFKREASKEEVDDHQGFSATHVKGKSAIKKSFGFFKSSLSKK